MLYEQVLAACWPFVLVAAVAERQAFRGRRAPGQRRFRILR